MTLGKLYGVGVGPGAPDLMTLRAVATLKHVQVIIIPRSSDYGTSVAWAIAKSNVGDVHGQERIFLTFPMSMDPDVVGAAWEKAFVEIDQRLQRGLSIAFIAEGDPMVFSSFVYLQRAAAVRWPEVELEIIPAVTSITAVAAVSGVPLADGQERIAIIPGLYGVADLENTLDNFDTTVLMKIGPKMNEIVETLERKGLVDKAVYVVKATMPEQKVVNDVRDIRKQRGDCFSMMLIAKRDRSGVLVGDCPFTDREMLK